MTNKERDYLIAVLRKGTLGSAARNECLRRASKKVMEHHATSGREFFKLYWQCALCKEWYRDKNSLEVDHITEIGPFKGDWHDYIERMYFCGQENLRALCVPCHMKKTAKNAREMYVRKNKK